MALSRPLLGARRSVVIALLGIAVYTVLVDAGASVVRAAIMSGLALISVGANGLGNPALAVLALLAGRDVLRTDQHGAITVETDGEQMWVAVSH